MWNLDLDSLVSDAEANGEKWAVSVQNLSDGSVCEKNGKVSMQSASVIKVFIMATVYHSKFFYNPKSWYNCHLPDSYP